MGVFNCERSEIPGEFVVACRKRGDAACFCGINVDYQVSREIPCGSFARVRHRSWGVRCAVEGGDCRVVATEHRAFLCGGWAFENYIIVWVVFGDWHAGCVIARATHDCFIHSRGGESRGGREHGENGGLYYFFHGYGFRLKLLWGFIIRE